jgi:hypothetical protein
VPHPIITGKTRWEVFLENQNSDLTPINWRGILPYIGHKTQTSYNVGTIRLQNNTYLLAKNGKYAQAKRCKNGCVLLYNRRREKRQKSGCSGVK